MASIDGSKSLLAACDEFLDHECGPCKTGGNRKEAKQYCCDCREYLCDSCVEYHTRLPSLKNHKIFGADVVNVGSGQLLTVYCCCNKNQEVTFYCKEHDDVICSLCKGFKHHTCQTSPIQQKSSGYTTDKLKSIISRTKSLKDKYDQLKQKCVENKNELKQSKETCKKEIKAFRKELDTFLDKLEQKMLAELEQLETDEQLRIDQQISTLTAALQMLDADYHTLDAAKIDGRTQVMFASDIQTSKSLQGCASRLADLEKDVQKFILSFENNKKFADLQNDVTALGSLKIIEKICEQKPKTVLPGQQVGSSSTKTVLSGQQVGSSSTKTVLSGQQVGSRTTKTVLLGQKVGSRREVNVRLTNDERSPWITGCVAMPNDYIVICDYRNKTLKLLDNTLSVTGSCEMSYPWDISVLDTNNVIVTIPDGKKLQQVQVFPQLKVGRTIQLDKECCGVEVSGENIYVSCHDGNVIEVIVLDKQGNVQPRLECSRKSLLGSLYITVSRGGDRVFVSDWCNNTITCMAADGSIIYQYTDKDLECPSGTYCDDSNNILVCCEGSNIVRMITAEGKLYNTILSSKDGIKHPCSIVYRQSDDILIVGCISLDHLFVYHLTK